MRILQIITEVANVLHAQNLEQMKNMMTMFQLLLTAMQLTVTVVPPNTNCQTHRECPYCKKEHANHDKCWELEANKDSRPANWNTTQSAWRCLEDEPTEQWQPG